MGGRLDVVGGRLAGLVSLVRAGAACYTSEDEIDRWCERHGLALTGALGTLFLAVQGFSFYAVVRVLSDPRQPAPFVLLHLPHRLGDRPSRRWKVWYAGSAGSAIG